MRDPPKENAMSNNYQPSRRDRAAQAFYSTHSLTVGAMPAKPAVKPSFFARLLGRA